MVHVSKHPLKKELTKKLFAQLSKVVSKSSRSKSVSPIVELLTEAEHVMLAKRLAAILMLREGCPARTVSHTLQMSRSTVMLIKAEYLAGHYNIVVRAGGRSKAEKEEMWKTIEVVLRLGMPSMGKDRWKWLDAHFAHDSKAYRR